MAQRSNQSAAKKPVRRAKKLTLRQTVENSTMAMFIAIVVRNAMETFHCKNLSDAQMRELNPLIRNAIYSALDARIRSEFSEAANAWASNQLGCIPSYWQEPQLLEGYEKTLETYEPDRQVRERKWKEQLRQSQLKSQEGARHP